MSQSENLCAEIFAIKRFAVHDGPGIRTTVFFKGCPLRCIWCHNPEGLSSSRELGYLEHKCISCGRCVRVCPNGAHFFDKAGTHRFDRAVCTACGRCAEACFQGCLTLYGRTVEIEPLLEELLADREFFDASSGGVTLSGGECLQQAAFCTRLLCRLKELGIHTAVDTCGFTSKAVLDSVMPYTDLFLYDIKAIDEAVHIRCTSQSNSVILENLKYLSAMGQTIELRLPYVPGYSAGEIEKIGRFLCAMQGIRGVRLLPCHNYAGTKYSALGMHNELPTEIPSDSDIHSAAAVLRAFGLTVLH